LAEEVEAIRTKDAGPRMKRQSQEVNKVVGIENIDGDVVFLLALKEDGSFIDYWNHILLLLLLLLTSWA
jgi:hypothetical protein